MIAERHRRTVRVLSVSQSEQLLSWLAGASETQVALVAGWNIEGYLPVGLLEWHRLVVSSTVMVWFSVSSVSAVIHGCGGFDAPPLRVPEQDNR
jgi:hypothetical protein